MGVGRNSAGTARVHATRLDFHRTSSVVRTFVICLDVDERVLFARSEASEAAGRAFLVRVGSRQRDRDSSVTTKTIDAQLAATKAWGAAPRTGPYAYLSGIEQPVLVADGEADVVRPTTNSKALAQGLPSARLVIYPDSAQGFLFQYPGAFAKDVAAFLRRP